MHVHSNYVFAPFVSGKFHRFTAKCSDLAPFLTIKAYKEMNPPYPLSGLPINLKKKTKFLVEDYTLQFDVRPKGIHGVDIQLIPSKFLQQMTSELKFNAYEDEEFSCMGSDGIR